MAVGQAAKTASAAAMGLIMIATFSSAALSDNEADTAKLAQCAKDLCGIIVSKKTSGPDLNCDLTKTWQKEDIQKGANSKNLMWDLGSARCHAKVSAKRPDILAAIGAQQSTFRLEKQAFACEVGAEKYQLQATLAPEIVFKNGAATSVSLHMADIQGSPLIKGVVWTAVKLEESFGILQKDMVREVNRFIKKECPKILDHTK